ncbi:MAG: hypothetical protein NC117_10895 [Pseudoflavonifractor sp.]|nr:hypothetical protein [Pseudoflavonifractor sp.]
MRNNIFHNASITLSPYTNGGRNNTIEHNTFYYTNSAHYVIHGTTYSIIRDNIVIATQERSTTPIDMSDYGNTIVNNVLSWDESHFNSNFPDNYYVGATLENTFIDNISGDRYLLRDDSVAKGKATDGGDCGAFGGATPYVLSGIPVNMPHIVEALIPSAPTDGKLDIKLKVATQND